MVKQLTRKKTDGNSFAVLFIASVLAVVVAIADKSLANAASVATVVIARCAGHSCAHNSDRLITIDLHR